MNIVVTGASGFLGKSLIVYLSKVGYNVIPMHRKDFIDNGLLDEKLKNSNVIINLAGETIFQRWSKKNKKRIINSRIETTRKIVDYINNNKSNVHLINASAIGIYNSIGQHDEYSSNYSDNFLSEVAQRWEKEAQMIKHNHNKLSIMRIGIVLGNRGGAFKKLYGVTKFFLGSIIGKGQQYMSYIHLEDFCEAINFIIKNELTGVVNLTAPNPVTNKTFVVRLGKSLNRPILFRIPKVFLRIFLGESHVLLTENQFVVPKYLLNNNFRFKYSNIDASINALINTYPK